MTRGLFILFISLTAIYNNGLAADKINTGLREYKKGNYAKAIQIWEKELNKSRNKEPQVLNFTGNAHYKLKNYAKAIAYYEKSIREDYNQPDAKFNIKVIRAKLGLDTENKTLFTNDIIRKISFFLSSNTLKLILIILGIILLILSIINYFKGVPRFDDFKAYAFICGFLVLGLYLFQIYFKSETGRAVVVVESTAFENMNLKGDSKTLREGEIVKIEDRIGEAIQVRTEADKLLWIYKSNVIKI